MRSHVLSLLLVAASGCLVEVPLDDLACSEAHRCVSGYVCRSGWCVLEEDATSDGGAPREDAGPIDGGAPDAGTVDGGFPDGGPLPAVDAGDDGGTPSADAGTDGGVDAGFDAGPDFVIFLDNTAADFTLGDETLGAGWDSAENALSLDDAESAGTFTSRVFEAPWEGELSDLFWEARAPYGKSLPTGVGDDMELAEYEVDGVDLTGLVFLLPADGALSSAVAADDEVPDESGHGHPTAIVDNPPALDSVFTDGMFAQALSLERDDYLRLTDSDTHADFEFESATFTWAGWTRIPGCAASDNNVILLGGEDPHIWLGATCNAGEANFQVRDDANAGGSATGSGTSRLVDGDWHHLAGVKGVGPEQSRVFLDGELVATRDDDWGTFGNFTKELFIGEFPIGTAPNYNYSSKLTVDEVVVFDRALSNAEVGALYRRGALRARIQVRACPTAACLTVPFVGPDGTSSTYFAEPTSGASPNRGTHHVFAGSRPVGRYFQYRVFLESDDPLGARPAISRVRLAIDRP